MGCAFVATFPIKALYIYTTLTQHCWGLTALLHRGLSFLSHLQSSLWKHSVNEEHTVSRCVLLDVGAGNLILQLKGDSVNKICVLILGQGHVFQNFAAQDHGSYVV